MILHSKDMQASEIYHTTMQTLLPRPIAWVLSQHQEGHLNLAPFSYFTAVSSEPPLLVFSVGDKASGEGKHTDARAIDPLARLGGTQYGHLGSTLNVPRPK